VRDRSGHTCRDGGEKLLLVQKEESTLTVGVKKGKGEAVFAIHGKRAKGITHSGGEKRKRRKQVVDRRRTGRSARDRRQRGVYSRPPRKRRARPSAKKEKITEGNAFLDLAKMDKVRGPPFLARGERTVQERNSRLQLRCSRKEGIPSRNRSVEK